MMSRRGCRRTGRVSRGPRSDLGDAARGARRWAAAAAAAWLLLLLLLPAAGCLSQLCGGGLRARDDLLPPRSRRRIRGPESGPARVGAGRYPAAPLECAGERQGAPHAAPPEGELRGSPAPPGDATGARRRRGSQDRFQGTGRGRPLGYCGGVNLDDVALFTPARPKRCGVCGKRVARRPEILSLAERYARGRGTSGLVARFLEHERAAWARLLRPEYHFFHSRTKRVHKELSESLAILDALGGRLEHFRHVVDLCCGKSLTSAILAARRPSVHITAVDIVSSDTVPHYAEAGVSSVEYVQTDILSDRFPVTLARRAAEAGGDTAVLGVHCCGRLSTRAVELFRDMEEVRACALMPCCGPNAESAPSAMAHLYGVGLGDEEFYQAWCDHLQADLESVPGATVRRVSVPDVLSPKRVVLTAWRPPRPSSLGQPT